MAGAICQNLGTALAIQSCSVPQGFSGTLAEGLECLLSSCSQQQLVPGTLPMQQPEQEYVTWDALQLQAQVSNLQLSHIGMDENSKLPEPGGQTTTGQGGSTEPGSYPQSTPGPGEPMGGGGRIICSSRPGFTGHFPITSKAPIRASKQSSGC